MSKPLIDLLEKTLRREGVLRLTASGNSMKPLIRDGQTVWIRHCGLDETSVGDIVLVKGKKLCLLHRVHRIDSTDRVITKGDSSRRYDSPFLGSHILGKVILVETARAARIPWHVADAWQSSGGILLARWRWRLTETLPRALAAIGARILSVPVRGYSSPKETPSA